jgi:DNA-binding NtrC family response regulator
MGRILVVDGEAILSTLLASELELDGHTVSLASSFGDARKALAENQYDAVLSRQRLTDGDWFSVLAATRGSDANLAFVLVSVRTAAEPTPLSLDQGVFDFLSVPAASEVARATVQRACDHTTLRRENSLLKKAMEQMKGTATTGPNGESDADNLHWIQGLPDRLDLRALLAAVEKSVIEKTLQSTRGAQAEAARRLGLSRSDLSYKLSKYALRKVS